MIESLTITNKMNAEFFKFEVNTLCLWKISNIFICNCRIKFMFENATLINCWVEDVCKKIQGNAKYKTQCKNVKREGLLAEFSLKLSPF